MQNFMISGDPLSLDRIRSTLIRLEDTIIFSLIERAQFAHNPRIYERGGMKQLSEIGFEGSWLEWFLKETETFHAKARRYTSPDEYPFTTDLPKPLLPPLTFPTILYPNDVNVNASILSLYIRAIVPRIARQATLAHATRKRAQGVVGDDEFEDDGNYGSAATIDVEVLQAISRRVHYGKFVSESKFRSDPAAFIPHILNPNPDALAALITKPEVERKLLQRVRNKARLYGQDFGPDGQPLAASNGNGDNSLAPASPGGLSLGKIDVEGVVELYEHYIIPLTKEVEVEYLLKRLKGLSESEIEALQNKA
ncbi:chorismate mutase [Schizopora paradoxa]|uniref:Chorismate mutase n=1 Tax=Schizopora paradoxa TaxID=27342 RepID=A0A0H2RJF7_9AGAM|nr:chorismate mutase [Schizopora paradoxa]